MQLRDAIGALVLGLALGAAPAAARAEGSPFEEQKPGALVRVFTDSERVRVRSWMGDYALSLGNGLGLEMHVNHERVTIPAIDAPAGTPEAVDAITTASRPIAGNAFQDYVKVRNEFQGGVRRGRAALDYYHSSESDYLAQQLAARWDRDLGPELNLSVGASYGWDAIEPLADDDTDTGADRRTTLHGNVVATRVLTPSTMVRFGVEMNLVDGLQHNPYRNVYAGGTNVPERHPDERQRHDVFLKVAQYLSNRSSVKLSYRWYGDDWGIGSHEVATGLNQYLLRGMFAGWQYRWYTQDAADFHRDEYAAVDGIDGYRSGDYRMGELSSHLFGLALHLDFEALAEATPVLGRMGVWLSYERYFNSNHYSANILETGLDYRF